MTIILLILNTFDYILTLRNLGDPLFKEANPIMQPFVNNPLILTLVKLVIVPLLVYVLYRFKDQKIAQFGTFILCLVYLYAVVLGALIYITN